MLNENNADENGGNQNLMQIGGVDIDVQGIVKQFVPQFELSELLPITFQRPEFKLDVEALNAQNRQVTDALLVHGTFKPSPIMEKVEKVIRDTQRNVDRKNEIKINPDYMKTGYDNQNEGEPDANDNNDNGFQFNT